MSYWKPDQTGLSVPKPSESPLRPDTILVSIMMVNNETGAVMPIGERWCARPAKRVLWPYFTPTQSRGFEGSLRPRPWGGSHSISGAQGPRYEGRRGPYILAQCPHPSALSLRRRPESGYRSGTEAMPAILSFGAACRAQGAKVTKPPATCRRSLGECRQRLSEIDGLGVSRTTDAPHILNVSRRACAPRVSSTACRQDGVYARPLRLLQKGHRAAMCYRPWV